MNAPQCTCDEFFCLVCAVHGIRSDTPVAALFFFTARLFFRNPVSADAHAESDYIRWNKTGVRPLYLGAR